MVLISSLFLLPLAGNQIGPRIVPSNRATERKLIQSTHLPSSKLVAGRALRRCHEEQSRACDAWSL